MYLLFSIFAPDSQNGNSFIYLHVIELLITQSLLL
jgi:hypothetical protein